MQHLAEITRRLVISGLASSSKQAPAAGGGGALAGAEGARDDVPAVLGDLRGPPADRRKQLAKKKPARERTRYSTNSYVNSPSIEEPESSSDVENAWPARS